MPFPPDPALADMLRPIVGEVEVHFAPYAESRDRRAAKGANEGVDPFGLETPEITPEMAALWQRAHVLVGLDLPDEPRTVLPNLAWVQAISAGYDQFDRRGLAENRVRLSTASGIASVSIAEFVIARLLEVWKNLRLIEDQQRDQVWTEVFGTEVAGRTLLIAGLGSIGREVASRARAFGLHVIATRSSANVGDTDPDVDELHPAAALDELLRRADAVVCALPSNPATVDLFNRERFALMKSDAIFFNVGRGTLVVEQDLVAVLHEGHLRAAILDVTRREPIPEGDPLWAAPRLHISPHSAVSLDRYRENATAILVENARRYMAGERLLNEVDPPADER